MDDGEEEEEDEENDIGNSDEDENNEVEDQDEEDSGDDDDNCDAQQHQNTESTSSSSAKLPRRYVCQFPLCGIEYRRLHSLRMHHRSHTKAQPYYCKFPVVVASKGEDEDANEELGEAEAEEEAGVERECGEPFRRKTNAFRHIHARHYGVPKKAQNGWTAAARAAANAAISAYIGEQADILAREEAVIEGLRVHKVRPPGAPPLKYRCQWPDCGKYFVAPGKLHLHHRTHSEVRPFYCKWPGCTRIGVIEKSQMLKHILVEHLGLRSRSNDPINQGVVVAAVAEKGSSSSSNEETKSMEYAPASKRTGVSKAYTEEERAKAAPYLGTHQHLLEQERQVKLKRTEVVLPPPVVVKGDETATREKKTTSDFNFQALFSVPMTSPFPPVNFGPVFAVQIAVHKF